MKNRRRNNIIIGTLCCVLVLMGVGYAILSTTLNIGATANITGDFDIHFTNIQRSSSTITDTTLLSTMDEGTGITDGTNNHEGTFTAVLQKPTDYVIYTVSVANTGSIDGYLTFTFGDEHNNFNYYKDFYSVEFIRDDVDPDISTDILQPNATFTDNEVLENTTGTRTYKIKVMFKESASGFPDATTNGAFECSLNLTYSQQAPSQGVTPPVAGTMTWYYTNEPHNESIAIAMDSQYNVLYVLIINKATGEIDYNTTPEMGAKLTAYDENNEQFTINLLSVNPQDGDYIMTIPDHSDNLLAGLARNNVIYMYDADDETDYVISIDPTGSLEKYTNNGGNNQQACYTPLNETKQLRKINASTGESLGTATSSNLSAGDLVGFGTSDISSNEQFYVLENNNGALKLLSRYLINVGGHSKAWDNCSRDTSGLQDADIGFTRTNVNVAADFGDTNTFVAEAVDFENQFIYGAVPFSSTNFWWNSSADNGNGDYATGYSRHSSIYANSGIKSYVETYATTLSTMGLTGATGTVLSIQELGSICSTDFTGSNSSTSGCPNYVFETLYWLGSIGSDFTVWMVSADGSVDDGSFNNDNLIGIRPVINVTIS